MYVYSKFHMQLDSALTQLIACLLQKALYFPNIQGTSMASRKTTHTTDLFRGRVSVVAVLTARVSEVSRGWVTECVGLDCLFLA